MMIRLIHIAPTNLIRFIDVNYNRGLNMALAHEVLENEAYRDAMKELKGEKYLDNGFFELNKCLPPQDIIKAAKMIDANTLICPDGTTAGKDAFIANGYKVMCIPKSVEQFKEFMYDDTINLVGVSEEHFAYRHCPGVRYELFRDHLTEDMPKKKIHLLGGTDRIAELGLLVPFSAYIYSFDSSAAIWQGHLGHDLRYLKRKDTSSVEFDKKVDWNLLMESNIRYMEDMIK